MYEFKAYGHENITAKHKTTLEFTKDPDLTLNGDCIVGIKADFSLDSIKDFIKNLKSKKIKIVITVNDLKEEINAEINPDFNSDKEMVIRKSDFKDERTFAIRSKKASFEIKRDFIGFLRNKKSRISVIIEKSS
jgi:hypothetical protein|tara:strand:- start:420 stop:821 length:402 start_codon:yes stop_codon:yes gene_type:complete